MTNKNVKEPIKVGFIALGCPKNVVDSEKMLAQIAQAGLLITPDPEDACVIVINTCGFIAPAKAEALNAIKQAVSYKTTGRVQKVIVAGCLPQRLGEQLFKEADGIDAIVGLGQRDDIAKIIKKAVSSDKSQAFLEHHCQPAHDDRSRLLITPNHWAYLRISEGCDHGCSFCTIPAIRGRFRSKPPEFVLAEAEELVKAGAVELNIIAQDTTYYGRDLKIKNGLATLLAELEKTDALVWLRLMYLYPVGITDKLIETIAKSEKIVPYLDIPIQHVNDKILKDMRRPESKESIRNLIENLRQAMPEIVLRTTIIVGFPGETAEQFDELIEFVNWAKFDCLGCFEYYPESGTAAAKMPSQVPKDVKQQRLEQLMLTQQQIAFARNKSKIGGQLLCLIDSVDSNGLGRGRFFGQAPDIDSICLIENCSGKPGDFLNTKVVGTKDYDLLVEQI